MVSKDFVSFGRSYKVIQNDFLLDIMGGELILFIVMGLFILSIFLYSYGTKGFTKYRDKLLSERQQSKSQKRQQQIKIEMAERQNQRDEFYRKARERSQEIQKELQYLGSLKLKN
mgnify:FL=1